MAKGSAGKPVSSGPSSTAAGGADPRMPEKARKYAPGLGRLSADGTLSGDDDIPPVDVSSMLGIIIGVFGVMMKQKVFCWISLLLAAQALANMRSAETDLKQIMCCLSFAVMGLFSAYFGPTHPATVGDPVSSS